MRGFQILEALSVGCGHASQHQDLPVSTLAPRCGSPAVSSPPAPSLSHSRAGLPLKLHSPATWPSSSCQAFLLACFSPFQNPTPPPNSTSLLPSPLTPAYAPMEPTLPISLLSILAKAYLTSCYSNRYLSPKGAHLSWPCVSLHEAWPRAGIP